MIVPTLVAAPTLVIVPVVTAPTLVIVPVVTAPTLIAVPAALVAVVALRGMVATPDLFDRVPKNRRQHCHPVPRATGRARQVGDERRSCQAGQPA
jgi:hypothetical protein